LKLFINEKKELKYTILSSILTFNRLGPQGQLSQGDDDDETAAGAGSHSSKRKCKLPGSCS